MIYSNSFINEIASSNLPSEQKISMFEQRKALIVSLLQGAFSSPVKDSLEVELSILNQAMKNEKVASAA